MLDPAKLLSGIPAALRDPLIAEYKGLTAEYAKGAWKHASLDGGRFCEVVYTILEGALTGGAYASTPKKPRDFVGACRALESKAPVAVGDHSLRVLIPRVLPGVYDVRNNRNVGHVGGDVVANEMDADFVRDAATWVLCELVRVFHGVDTKEAQTAVDALTERRHPLVWEYDGFRRVLDPELSGPDQALLLLHASTGWTKVKDLQEEVRYARNFRGQVIARLVKQALIIHDESQDRVVITPRGSNRAEALLAENSEAPR